MHDLLWSWLIPNAAYDLGKQIILSLVLGVGGAALLGPILHWARGARNIVATAVVIFFCAFFLSAYIRPAPATPNLVAVPAAMIVGTPSGVPGNIAGVVAIVEVINRGTGASVARNWSLKAKIDDATYEGIQIRIPPNL